VFHAVYAAFREVIPGCEPPLSEHEQLLRPDRLAVERDAQEVGTGSHTPAALQPSVPQTSLLAGELVGTEGSARQEMGCAM
jgi:hypothetical protein